MIHRSRISRFRFTARLIPIFLLLTCAFPVYSEPTSFPLTVRDSTGRSVTVAGPPQSIVSLAPSLTEILFAVGAGNAVTGVTTYCNFPPEVADIEKIGGFSAKTISIETILSLEPELVFADASRHATIVETLERYEIDVIATNATSIQNTYDVIELVGTAGGRRDEALELVESMRERVGRITAVTDVIPEDERPRVFWEVFDDPLMAAGPSTFIGELIVRAGGINIFSDASESWPRVSHEELIARNPEVLMSSDSHGEKLTPDHVAERTGWGGLAAVQNGRIYLFNGDIVSRPGPRIVDALEAMFAKLHPELVE